MTAVPAMPSEMPATLFQRSFSSAVSAFAIRSVQNGVVALSTEARPAPSCGLAGEDQRERDDVVEQRQQEEAPGIGQRQPEGGPARREIECSAARRSRPGTAPASADGFRRRRCGRRRTTAPDRAEQQKPRPASRDIAPSLFVRRVNCQDFASLVRIRSHYALCPRLTTRFVRVGTIASRKSRQLVIGRPRTESSN